MTISYSGNFCRLLFRWKGSLWRLVWKELFFYLVLFYTIHLSYVFGIDYMGYYYRNKFEQLCSTFDQYAKMIPLTFLLGFYVSTVVTRWWRQFECLSWPEDILSILCTVIHRTDEISQKRRHTIARYLNLSTALAWRDISSKIRMRFPTVESLVSAGLLTQNEYDILEKNNDECEALRWMTPLHWIQQIMKKEEEENKPTTSLLNNFMTELKILRQSLRKLYCYDWVCVPLVYTQVAALATYAFFFFSLFARQNTSDNRLDMLLPVFTIVQFLFYVGWFKVGQDLMRPFGLDDDDIELNYILDRNIATSFALVNRLQNMPLPEEEEDYFWKNRDCHIGPLPHTEHSSQLKEHRPKLLSYVNVGSDDDANINCMEPHRDKKHINW